MAARSTESELRVVALHDSEPERFITPIRDPRSLPRGVVDLTRISIENAARQVLDDNHFDLPPMSAVARLMPQTNEAGQLIHGYVLEPVHGRSIDLRSYTARASYMDEFLQSADRHPDMYDPIDIAFIQQCLQRAQTRRQPATSRRPGAPKSRPTITRPNLTESL